MKSIGRQTPQSADGEVIRLLKETPDERKPGTNWGRMLVLFMRTVAGLWILRGLVHWESILAHDQTPFESLAPVVAGCVVFFAVADLVAAVGLWLASAWGGVLWLFSAMANVIVTLAVPDFHAGGKLMVAIDFALIATYFVLTWQAARDRED